MDLKTVESVETATQYIERKVSGVLEKLTIDILEEKPDEVVDYMIKWLDDKGTETQNYYECERLAR